MYLAYHTNRYHTVPFCSCIFYPRVRRTWKILLTLGTYAYDHGLPTWFHTVQAAEKSKKVIVISAPKKKGKNFTVSAIHLIQEKRERSKS